MTPVQVRAAHRAQLALLKQYREKARDQQQNLASAEAWWRSGFCTECSLHYCIWKCLVPPWCYCHSWCLSKSLSSSWRDQDPALLSGAGFSHVLHFVSTWQSPMTSRSSVVPMSLAFHWWLLRTKTRSHISRKKLRWPFLQMVLLHLQLTKSVTSFLTVAGLTWPATTSDQPQALLCGRFYFHCSLSSIYDCVNSQRLLWRSAASANDQCCYPRGCR